MGSSEIGMENVVTTVYTVPESAAPVDGEEADVGYEPTECAGEEDLDGAEDDLARELGEMMDHVEQDEQDEDKLPAPVTSMAALVALLTRPGDTPSSIGEQDMLTVAMEAEDELREQRALEAEAERARRCGDWEAWQREVAGGASTDQLEVRIRARVRARTS